MKQVYKCDFCYKTDANADVILEHESSCSFNPALKKCWTCKHNVDEGMPISGSMYVCQKGISYSDKEEVEDNGNCSKWEKED